MESCSRPRTCPRGRKLRQRRRRILKVLHEALVMRDGLGPPPGLLHHFSQIELRQHPGQEIVLCLHISVHEVRLLGLAGQPQVMFSLGEQAGLQVGPANIERV